MITAGRVRHLVQKQRAAVHARRNSREGGNADGDEGRRVEGDEAEVQGELVFQRRAFAQREDCGDWGGGGGEGE